MAFDQSTMHRNVCPTDEVELVGMVKEATVIGHQIFATVSAKRGATLGPEDRVVNG
jgi:hypothetical protein